MHHSRESCDPDLNTNYEPSFTTYMLGNAQFIDEGKNLEASSPLTSTGGPPDLCQPSLEFFPTIASLPTTSRLLPVRRLRSLGVIPGHRQISVTCRLQSFGPPSSADYDPPDLRHPPTMVLLTSVAHRLWSF
ncbi:hypothetical protein KFK09_009872 [Dendrobium nobile]|uniref:Uncharacterized protein n=1 Tax=Dendrobium nobile TaxID=94219 RepID=A0A8T3BKP8_DENNO|nr:hypothetical protein KFK09_009872 [Dendrobium nobile]